MKLWKTLVLVFCFYFIFLGIYITIQLLKPVGVKKTEEVYIAKGTSFSGIANTLKERGLIRDEKIFIIVGKISGVERKARAGYYVITPDMKVLDILKKLLKGKVVEYVVTVLPGDSLYEIFDKLSNINQEFKENFWTVIKDKEFLKALNVDAPSLEGYIYPDTYIFPKGMKIEEVLEIMVKRMWSVYDENLRRQTKEKGFTANQILTLASIIEKEAKVEEEKPLISAVYHNRLKLGMPLQADPTAIYGVKRFKEGVSKKDLKNKTPYNTYIIRGLPPGPIASPSKSSIVAALNPAKVSYLYFVSKGDGTHEFSADYKSHILAINKIKKYSNEY
ncbi:MAG: endolytic transglycosylase MltG [Thermodesulfovibrio sp.]|nr:endolytic transglycosylase MltG [Thermodesulfovibrio sp.]